MFQQLQTQASGLHLAINPQAPAGFDGWQPQLSAAAAPGTPTCRHVLDLPTHALPYLAEHQLVPEGTPAAASHVTCTPHSTAAHGTQHSDPWQSAQYSKEDHCVSCQQSRRQHRKRNTRQLRQGARRKTAVLCGATNKTPLSTGTGSGPVAPSPTQSTPGPSTRGCASGAPTPTLTCF